MKKFWALIISNRVRVFSLGKHESVEKASDFAQAFCDRKNDEAAKHNQELSDREREFGEWPEHELAYIMDENDLRTLTGEVHRPHVIAHERREIAVETPTRVNEVCGCGGHCPSNEHTEETANDYETRLNIRELAGEDAHPYETGGLR